MNYGTSSYGSTAYSGATASQWYYFLSYLLYSIGTHEAITELPDPPQFFSLFLRKSSENTDVTIEAFTFNDPDETPQSQGMFGGQFAQAVIGGARFIKVSATIGGIAERIEVRGRFGD